MHPVLPDQIEVLPGTDVAGEWDRFRVFEALHHRMSICNPMSSDDLGLLVEILNPAEALTMVDIACGHGEMLIRAAEQGASGVGVDLSPWVLVRALDEAGRRVPSSDLRWVLGNARDLPRQSVELASCLGASWIWHGFGGTVDALLSHLTIEGRIAIGDLRLRSGADLDAIVETHGRVLTADEQAEHLRSRGLTILERIEPGKDSWDDYQRRIDVSARAWSELHPGPEAEGYLEEQAAWRRDHDRDMEFLDWTVWIASKP